LKYKIIRLAGFKARKIMQIAVISDIHSNLEALTKALEIIDQRSIENIVCAGDIVGYGANPNECIEIVRKRCSAVIKGNHDEAVLNNGIADDFTADARSAILWTCNQLRQENIGYLRTLPLSYSGPDIFLVHSSPCNPSAWRYIFDEYSAAEAFRCFSEPICFIGHTHYPAIFSSGRQKKGINRGERYLINCGSIGQPRDRNPHLSFGIFDTDKWSYENIRSAYDVETAAQKILKTGLPPMLGHRLLMGI
jgi:predicted phosphodiesterase